MVRFESRETVRWKTAAYSAWAIIGFGLIAYAAVIVLGRLSGALVPFVLASLFVFLLKGGVNWIASRGLPRGLAVAVCYLVAVLILGGVLVFLIPPMADQLVGLARSMPDLLESLQEWFSKLQVRFNDIVIPSQLQEAAGSLSKSLGDISVSIGDAVARGAISAGSGVATVIFDLFMGMVIAFWVLKDLPKIRTELATLVGHRYQEDFENLTSTVARVVGGYLRGQTIASVVTGLLAWIFLSLVGVRYALIFGILTLVLNYIPYIGPTIVSVLVGIVGLFTIPAGPFSAPVTALLGLAAVSAAQQLTDLFVTPRVMSSQVDLHPTLVIFSLLVGGTLMGVWGMLVAIPLAATAKGLFVYYYERKTNRSLATEDGALFRTTSPDEDEEPESETSVAGGDDGHRSSER